VPKLEINARHWPELNRLLDEALDRRADEREEWLQALAPEFDEFKPYLRELLSNSVGNEQRDFLSALPALAIPVMEPPAGTRADQPHDQVGPYRLIRELGGGGMGTVWLAERTDGLVNRPVALKLPHGAWKRAGLVERMAREREILATLNHPNIARLYDAGLTTQGQPYLALEYVQGHAIDEYLKNNPIDTNATLHLFAQVAHAVAYAHSKLIIHRDLKPANILVTGDGQVRLLDFGIAKLLEEGLATETKLTELSGRALTLDYASPEQILGEPLTIASDVYSLGVVLYEMLSGERPYKLRRDTRGALEDAIVQAEPMPPSSVVDGQHRKGLRGDLDTIVLKALRKQPLERYATVHALLDDIERYLSARPVLAQRDSAWYRARKFVARNSLAVAAASSVAIAILVGTGVVAWQARIAFTERNRAEEVTQFIASVFREADPTRGGDVLSAVELLQQAERRLQDRQTDARTKLELLAIISESLFGLQQNAEAARVAQDALHLEAANPTQDVLLKSRLHLVLSQSLEYLGRNEEALEQLKQASALMIAADQQNDPFFVQVKLHEAALGLAMADYKVAERAAGESVALATRLIGPRSAEVATALQLLSHAFVFTQRDLESVESSEEAFKLMRELHANDLTHPKVIDSAMYYSRSLSEVGRFDEAAEVISNALENAIRIFGEDNRMVGELYSNAVPPDLQRGALKGAVDKARRSLAIYLREAKQDTRIHAYRLRLLGHTLLAARAHDAVPTLQEAVRLSSDGDNGRGVLLGRASLGMALVHAGRIKEGEAELRATIAAAAPNTRPYHQASRHIGVTARLLKRNDEAVHWLEQASSEENPNHLYGNELASVRAEFGLAKLALGDIAGADELFQRAEMLFSETEELRISPARADLLVGRARLELLRDNPVQALTMLEQADQFWRDFDGDNRGGGEAAYWLARCLEDMGRPADARIALARAETLLHGSTIPTDVELMKLARAR
jgi:eukaryotic-like serine/threonine-protein kinase